MFLLYLRTSNEMFAKPFDLLQYVPSSLNCPQFLFIYPFAHPALQHGQQSIGTYHFEFTSIGLGLKGGTVLSMRVVLEKLKAYGYIATIADVLVYIFGQGVSLKLVGVDQFPGTRILKISDTHHGFNPILRAYRYCRTEAYDIYVVQQAAHMRILRALLPDKVLVFEQGCPVVSSVLTDISARKKELVSSSQFVNARLVTTSLHPKRCVIAEIVETGCYLPVKRQHIGSMCYIEEIEFFLSHISVSLSGMMSGSSMYPWLAARCVISDKLYNLSGLAKWMRHKENILFANSHEDFVQLSRETPENIDLWHSVAQGAANARWQIAPQGTEAIGASLGIADPELRVRRYIEETRHLEDETRPGAERTLSGGAESIAALFQIVQELSIFFSRVLINYSEGERVVGELILESLVATLCAQDFVNSLQEPTPPFVSIGVPQLTGPLNTLMKQQNFTFGIFVIRDLNTSANIAHLWEYCNTHDLEFTLFDAGVIMQSDLFSNPFASAKNLFFELLDLTCVRIANRANCENQYRKNQDWMIDRTAQQPTTKADFGLDHVSQLN